MDLVRVFLLVGLTTTAQAAAPHGLRLEPPTAATMGEPLPVSIVLDGLKGAEPTVMLHYLPQGSRVYLSQRLEPQGLGRYTGAIPASGTLSLAVAYYIEATGPEGAWSFSMGSAEWPLRVELDTPASKSGRTFSINGVMLFGPLAGLVTLVWLRHRHRKHDVLDQLFWVRILLPLLHRPDGGLTAEVTRMSKQPLVHPVHGARLYPRPFILRKLRKVRSMDLAKLVKARDRYFGSAPDSELRLPPLAEAAASRPRERRRTKTADVPAVECMTGA